MFVELKLLNISYLTNKLYCFFLIFNVLHYLRKLNIMISTMEKNIAIKMADLSGYTALTETHGAMSAAALIDNDIQIDENCLVGDCKIHQRKKDEIMSVPIMSKIYLIPMIFICGCKQSSKQDAVNKYETNNLSQSLIKPERFGVDSEELNELVEYIKNEELNVNSVVISKNGNVALDAHFYPNKKEYLHDIASITKSLTSLAIGIAIDNGKIKDENQKIMQYFPEYANLFNSAEKKAITIKHLLTMSSGLCSDIGQGELQRELMKGATDPIGLVLKNSLSNIPGDEFVYCSTGVQLLSILISKTTGLSLEDYLKKYLFDPLSIDNVIFGKDISGYSNGSGDCFLTSMDLMKVGELILNKGIYDGNRIISENWINKSLDKTILVGGDQYYGYLWWSRNEFGGIIEAQGRGGQRLTILEKDQVVIVMYGTGFEPGDIGGFIINSLKNKGIASENNQGNKILHSNLIEVSDNYDSFGSNAIPIFAENITDNTYVFDKNVLGFTLFSLNTENAENSYLILDLNRKISQEVGKRKIELGMKGKYKISRTTKFKTPMGARAKWTNQKSINIDYNEFSNNHKYNILISFEDNKAIWKIKDEADFNDTLTIVSRFEETGAND